MQLYYILSEIFVIGGILSALVVIADSRNCRQQMRIMHPVWVLTALWASFFGLWAYISFGRVKRCRTTLPEPANDMQAGKMDDMQAAAMPGMKMDTMPGMQMEQRPKWQSVVLSTLHCGAGCTLADITGEWLHHLYPIAIGGSLVAGAWVSDYILALLFGIGFQYAAIREMQRNMPRHEVVRRAAKADFLSLTAWQVGMYAWMAVVVFVFNDGILPARDNTWFWFMMQVAMGFGFIVALPVNALLIKYGIKRGM